MNDPAPSTTSVDAPVADQPPESRSPTRRSRRMVGVGLLVLAALASGVGFVVFQPKESGGSALPLSDDYEAAAARAPLRSVPSTTRPTAPEVTAEQALVVPPGGSLVATAVQVEGEVAVWANPDALASPTWMLPAETEFWGPRHFLVLEDAGDWLRVAVPVRPNGSEGWIPRDDVRLSVSEFLVRIHLDQPSLEVWRDDELVFSSTPAIGNPRAPTPLGRWFIRDIFQWDETSVYGPWVLALSAYSDQIEKINGSDAVVAIHGTNRPDLLGQAVSLGCIRLHNDDVTRLAQTVPVGTPVEVVASSA